MSAMMRAKWGGKFMFSYTSGLISMGGSVPFLGELLPGAAVIMVSANPPPPASGACLKEQFVHSFLPVCAHSLLRWVFVACLLLVGQR